MTPVHVDGSSSYATVMGDDVAQNSDSPTERTSRVPMEAEMTKPRSTTGQSSHAYEQVTLKKDGDTDADYINSSAIEAQINETK